MSEPAADRQQRQNPDITIIVDTREQDPLSFSLPTEHGTLTTGDYSVCGLERFIAIERKSVDDLVGCLKGKNRDRFERELSRGRGLDFFALVIECDLRDLADGNYRSEMKPKAVVQSLLAFCVRYGTPIFFCPGRTYAARVIESLLVKYVEELQKRMGAVA